MSTNERCIVCKGISNGDFAGEFLCKECLPKRIIERSEQDDSFRCFVMYYPELLEFLGISDEMNKKYGKR